MTLSETESNPEGRVCTKCKTFKLFSEFGRNAKGKYGYAQKCKPCAKERDQWSHIGRRYGLTGEEYNALLEAQGGVCAICKNSCVPGRRLAVDHDHNTGDIRALLCMKCNKFVVGRHTLDEARKIVAYLENPPADVVFGFKRKVPAGMEKPKRARRKKRVTRRRRVN